MTTEPVQTVRILTTREARALDRAAKKAMRAAELAAMPRWKRTISGAVGFALLLAPVFLVGKWALTEPTPAELAERAAAAAEAALPVAQRKNKDMIGACTEAQMQITRVLKAPSTASFPFSCREMAYKVDGLVLTIRMQVDAQNSFGALIRTTFEVKLEGRGKYWNPIPLIPPRQIN
jgi:hypothetical protein